MDKVAEMLYSLGHWKEREKVDRLAKQIRQQIGREILKTIPDVKGATKVFQEKLIREVCQLEEE